MRTYIGSVPLHSFHPVQDVFVFLCLSLSPVPLSFACSRQHVSGELFVLAYHQRVAVGISSVVFCIFFYVHLIIRVRALLCVYEESRTTVPIVPICSVCTLHNGARWNAIPRCIPFLPLFNSFLKSLPTEFRQQTTIGTKSSLVPLC